MLRFRASLLTAWLGGLIVLTASGLCTPAQAQYYRGSGFPFLFSPFPFFQRPAPRPAARHHHRESTRRERGSVLAPPPAKSQGKAAALAVVLGDSMAEWLGFGLEQAYADSSDIRIVRRANSSFGLTDQCSGEARKLLDQALATEKPAFVAVMLGMNDRRPMKVCDPKTPDSRIGHAFRSKEWADAYGKEVDGAIAALKGKNIPVFWVGLPPIANIPASDIGFLNAIYRDRAQQAGIRYVDVWDAFVDEDGDFAMRGPDVNGQRRTLRADDGVHFTKAGARKLALFVEREAARIGLNGAPALPAAEQDSPSKPKRSVARPAAGPVVPLSREAGKATEGLLGEPARSIGSSPGRAMVQRASPATPGRADDFRWPRAGD
jgi:uncharacterized protein